MGEKAGFFRFPVKHAQQASERVVDSLSVNLIYLLLFDCMYLSDRFGASVTVGSAAIETYKCLKFKEEYHDNDAGTQCTKNTRNIFK